MRTSFVAGKDIYLSQRCRSVMGSTRKGKIYDLPLVRMFYNRLVVLSDNPIFLDVGANTGSYALLPAADDRLTCYAFEPGIEAYSILRENVKINNIEDKTFVYNMGLWSSRERLKLKVPMDGRYNGVATLGANPTRIDGKYKEEYVNCVAMDDFIGNNHLKVDAIKIDSEGAELEILKGAESTLKNQKPLLLVEYDNKNTSQFGYDREEIKEFLLKCGYNNFEVYQLTNIFVS